MRRPKWLSLRSTRSSVSDSGAGIEHEHMSALSGIGDGEAMKNGLVFDAEAG